MGVTAPEGTAHLLLSRRRRVSDSITRMSQEELRIFVERFMHFMNLWTVYSDFLSGKYLPSVDSGDNDDQSIPSVQITLMFMLYAFFYSLVEDSQDGLNGFRVWRERFPEEEHAIA